MFYIYIYTHTQKSAQSKNMQYNKFSYNEFLPRARERRELDFRKLPSRPFPVTTPSLPSRGNHDPPTLLWFSVPHVIQFHHLNPYTMVLLLL